MTFTFATPFDDIARVRLAVGDTDSDAHFLSDELINALITEYVTWQQAAIAACDYIIMQLSQPSFTADWLKVDNAQAIAAYERRRAKLETMLGGARIKVSSAIPNRIDGDEDESEYT